MSSWIQKTLDIINLDLNIMESKKREEAREERENHRIRNIFSGTLEESKVWWITLKEKTALEAMADKLIGYVPQHVIQQSVLKFLNKQHYLKDKYKKISKISKDNASTKIDAYIDASQYWNKKTTQIKRPDGSIVKWVFAVNDEMESVICKYRDFFIITTKSSHENIMREIEGRRDIEGRKPVFASREQAPRRDPVMDMLNQLD